MATSIVARMASVLCALVVLAAQVSGQLVQPSNSSLPNLFTQLTVTGAANLNPNVFNIAPLTQEVGLGGNANAVAVNQFTGDIQLVGPSNENNASQSNILYISCDPNTDTSNISPTAVVEAVGTKKVIILYSTTSQECNLTGEFPSTSIYTMVSAGDSNTLLAALQVSLRGQLGPNSTTGNPATTSQEGGPAPTTAVAMSILYSITGIITLLFLVIIATGAIRAHRHPERYGPRTGVSGRPRQSRAKGLARAMLETLPIVKFGDPEPAKPGSTEIELEDGNTSVHNTTEAVAVPAASENGGTRAASPTAAEVASGLGPAQAESINSGQEATKTEEGLGCSICTEDFTRGEDVRVLPCHHKYHPACVDPWLLNVSGTCPLCRHDLRPVPTETDPASPTAENSELPPPLNASEEGENGAEAAVESDNGSNNPQRRRMSRFLDLNRLRHAPPDERIAALRRLREQSQQEGEGAEDVEEPSRRARLTGRLRDTFRVRTRAAAQE